MTIELQISELVDLLESKPAPVFSEDPEKERLDRTTAFLRRLGETHAKISEDGKVSLSREAANDLFNLHNEYQNGVYDGIELTITNDGNGILDLLDHLYPAPETRPEITAKELKSLFDYVEEVKKTALFAPSETPLEIGQLANFDDVSLHRYNLDKIKRAASENQTVWDPINIYVQYSTTMGGALTGKVHKRLKEFIAELKADPIFSVPDSPEDILILEPTQVAEMGAKLEAFNARKRDIGLDWAALKEVLEPGYTTAGDDQQAVNAKLEEFQQALTAKGLVEWPLDKPMTISAELANDLFRQYENFKQSGQIDFKPGQAAGKGALDMLEHFARKAAADGEAVDAKQLREAQDYISYLNTKYPHIAGMPGQLKDNQSLTVYAAPNTLEQFKIARTLTNGNEVLSSFEIFRRVQDARAIFSTESDKQIERFCEQLVQDGAAQRAAQSTLQNLIIVTPDQSHALKDKFSEFQKKERDAALTPPAPTKNITLNLNRVEDALEPGYSLMPETNKEPLTTKILDFITALSKTGHLERTPDNKQINISAELANDLFRQYENFKQSGEIDFKPGQAAGKGALDVLAHVRNKAMAGPETVDAQELRHAHDYITDISAKQPLAAGLPGQLKDDQALQGNVIPWRFEQFNIAKSLQGDNKVLNNFEIFNRLYPNTPKPTFAGDLQQQIARFCTQLVKDGAATEAPHGLIITTPAQRLALRDKFHDFQNKERDATKEETVFNVERLAKFLNGSNLAYEPQDIQDFMEDLKRNHTVTGATGKDGELNITPTLMKNLATFHDQFKKRQPYAIPPLTLNIEFLYARFRRDTQPKSPSEHDQRLLKGFIRELSQDSSFPSRYGNTPDTLIIDARLESGLNAKFNIFMEKVALFERLASLENDPSRSTNDAPAYVELNEDELAVRLTDSKPTSSAQREEIRDFIKMFNSREGADTLLVGIDLNHRLDYVYREFRDQRQRRYNTVDVDGLAARLTGKKLGDPSLKDEGLQAEVAEFMDMLKRVPGVIANGWPGTLNITAGLDALLDGEYQKYKDWLQTQTRKPLTRNDSWRTTDTLPRYPGPLGSNDDDLTPRRFTDFEQSDAVRDQLKPMGFETISGDEMDKRRRYDVGTGTGRTNNLIVKHANEYADRVIAKLDKWDKLLKEAQLPNPDDLKSKWTEERRTEEIAFANKQIKKWEKRLEDHNTRMDGLIERRNGGLGVTNDTTLAQAIGSKTGRGFKNAWRFVASNSYEIAGKPLKKLKKPAKYLGLGLLGAVGIGSGVVPAIAVGGIVGVGVAKMSYVAVRAGAGVQRGIRKGYNKVLNAMGRKPGLSPWGSMKLWATKKYFSNDPDAKAKFSANEQEKQIRRLKKMFERAHVARKNRAEVDRREAAFRNEIKDMPLYQRLPTQFYSPERFGIIKDQATVGKVSGVKNLYELPTEIRDSFKDRDSNVNEFHIPNKPENQALWVAGVKAGMETGIVVTGFQPKREDFEALATSLARDWGAKRENKVKGQKSNNLTGGAQVHDAKDFDVLRAGEVLFVDPKTKEAYVLEHPVFNGALTSKVFGQVKVLTAKQQEAMGLNNLKPKVPISAMEIGTGRQVDLATLDAKAPTKSSKHSKK